MAGGPGALPQKPMEAWVHNGAIVLPILALAPPLDIGT